MSELPAARDMRAADFALGREAARLALARAGYRLIDPIGKDQNGLPAWPPDFVGSISHCPLLGASGNTGRVACALVGPRAEFRSIGLDVEATARFSKATYDAISNRIALPPELAWLDCSNQRQAALAALWVAKEAFFKLLYPLTGTYFGFHQAHCSWDDHANCFIARLERSLSDEFSCGWSGRVFVHVSSELATAWCTHPLMPRQDFVAL